MKFKLFLVLYLAFQIASTTYGQSATDTIVRNYMHDAKKYIQLQDYTSANEIFKKMFSLKKTLPDEVSYFYGITLLKQEKFVQAKSSFKKYNSLSGERGEFYKSSIEFIKETDKHICQICEGSGKYESKDTCSVCIGKGKVSVNCGTCKGKGLIYCSVCTGNGVVKQTTNFGDSYLNCKKCEGKGLVKCSACEGRKRQNVFCERCQGRKFLKSVKTCEHQAKH